MSKSTTLLTLPQPQHPSLIVCHCNLVRGWEQRLPQPTLKSFPIVDVYVVNTIAANEMNSSLRLAFQNLHFEQLICAKQLFVVVPGITAKCRCLIWNKPIITIGVCTYSSYKSLHHLIGKIYYATKLLSICLWIQGLVN